MVRSCHVTLASNSENFSFSPNSVLNFRKRYQIWGKLAREQKLQAKNKLGGGKHPLPPVLIGLKGNPLHNKTVLQKESLFQSSKFATPYLFIAVPLSIIKTKVQVFRNSKIPFVSSKTKGGFPLFAETTCSELASTRWLPEQFPVIV